MSAESWVYWTNNINVHLYKLPCKKRSLLLKVTPFYTANITSLCSWTAVVGTQSTALFMWGKGRDCSISVQTDRSVDRHQYHHQEWHLGTVLFARMHGQVFPQRTDVFQASVQSKPLWTKQIKRGVWTWPGMEASGTQSECLWELLSTRPVLQKQRELGFETRGRETPPAVHAGVMFDVP